MRTRILLLIFIVFAGLQCKKDNTVVTPPNNPSVITDEVRLFSGRVPLSGYDAFFIDTETHQVIDTFQNINNGFINVTDLKRQDYLIIARKEEGWLLFEFFDEQEIFRGTGTQLDLINNLSLFLQKKKPLEYSKFLPLESTDLELEVILEKLNPQVFSYRLESENGEIDIPLTSDENGLIKEQIAFTEEGRHNLIFTVELMGKKVQSLEFGVTVITPPKIDFSLEIFQDEAIRINWEPYTGDDFLGYRIWGLENVVGNCEVSRIRDISDQNVTTTLHRTVPSLEELCYSVTVDIEWCSGVPDNTKTIRNPNQFAVPVQPESTIFLNEKIFYASSGGTLPGLPIYGTINSYDFVNKESDYGSSLFDRNPFFLYASIVDGEPFFYINGEGIIYILNEELDEVAKVNVGEEFIPKVITDNGFLVYQNFGFSGFKVYDIKNSRMVGETPEIAFCSSMEMAPLKGGRFGFINSSGSPSSEGVIITIDDNGVYVDHETHDFGRLIQGNPEYHHFDYENDLLFLMDGGVHDLNDNFKKVAQLVNNGMLFHTLSGDGQYVGYHDYHSAALRVYDANSLTLHKELPLRSNPYEVYIDKGVANLIFNEGGDFFVKRIPID